MKRLILHIGHSKTGSSSIQWYLGHNETAMRKLGVFYPRTAHTMLNHNALLPPLDPDRELPSLIKRRVCADDALARKIIEDEWRSIVGLCESSNAKTVILSAERMFGIKNDVRAGQLFDRVREISTDINVSAYIRSPSSWYMSFAQQNIKRALTLMEMRIQPVRFVLESCASLSQGTMNVRPFDRKKLVGGDIVRDFIHSNISTDFADSMHDLPVQKNETMSPEAMSVQLELNRFFGESMVGDEWKLHRQASHIMRRIDQNIDGFGKPKLRPEIADHLVRMADDFKWLRDAYAIEFDDIDYSLIGKPLEIDPSRLTEIEQICFVNEDRKALLKAEFMTKLTEKPGARWVNSARSQLSGIKSALSRKLSGSR